MLSPARISSDTPALHLGNVCITLAIAAIQRKRRYAIVVATMKKSKGNIRLILIGVVIVIVLAVVFMRGDQLEKLVKTIQGGTPLFLILAVASQLCKYFSQGGSFIWCFRSVDSDLPFRETIKLVFGTFFVNTVAPSMNLAGTALVVDDAGKRGISAGRATGAALLMQLTIDSGFVVIMLIGFGVLTFTVGLQPGWLLLGLVAILLVGGLVTVMVLGGTRPQLVLKVLEPIERIVDKIARKLKRGPIDPWAESTVRSFSQASGLMVQHPSVTARAFLFSILASTCELGCFSFVGLAFGVHDIKALICGYVVATLFAMISITPQGVGVVEAAVLVAFTMFGIDQATGMAVIMVYRGIVFWLPFLIGAILIQRTKAFSNAGGTPKGSTKSTVANAPENSIAPSTAPSAAPDTNRDAGNADAPVS